MSFRATCLALFCWGGRLYGEVRCVVEWAYEGSIVNMGLKNQDGSVCYIIGVRKDIRAKINKRPGDSVRVTISER